MLSNVTPVVMVEDTPTATPFELAMAIALGLAFEYTALSHPSPPYFGIFSAPFAGVAFGIGFGTGIGIAHAIEDVYGLEGIPLPAAELVGVPWVNPDFLGAGA